MAKAMEAVKGADITSIIKTLIATFGVVIVFISFGTKLGRAEKSIEMLCDTVNKIDSKQQIVETDLNDVKIKAARFEGVMDERTENIQNSVNEMKGDIKTLLENLELAKD